MKFAFVEPGFGNLDPRSFVFISTRNLTISSSKHTPSATIVSFQTVQQSSKTEIAMKSYWQIELAPNH